MAESRIPEELQALLECKICFEEYTLGRMPCTLQCGHSLCFQCAFKLIVNSFITCPLDKQRFRVDAVSGNKSYMNLIGAVKQHYCNIKWKNIEKRGNHVIHLIKSNTSLTK